MRERIESVADILLAAAHADHHVEPQELERIEEILRQIWASEATPESLVRRVASFDSEKALEPEEVTRIGGILRELEPREDLPAHLVQRLADFDPGAFNMDEAVGPFLHEATPFKRRLLELAVAVHEADGELDFAEDTFVRELGYKLGMQESEFKDLLLEVFEPKEDGQGAGDAPIKAKVPPWAGDAVDPSPPLGDVGGTAPEWSFAPDLDGKQKKAGGKKKAGPKKPAARAKPAAKKKSAAKQATAKATAASKRPAGKKSEDARLRRDKPAKKAATKATRKPAKPAKKKAKKKR